MNIKIGKGGSGKVNSTKGGSGKTNQRKYIDLLPPNFISKVTLSGGTYSNGTYTRSSGGTTTFDGPDGKTIVLYGTVWNAFDPSFNGGIDPTYASLNLIDWYEEFASGTPTGVTANALSFLFDPIFYKNQIENERYKILLQGCSLPYVNGIYSLSLATGLYNGRGYYIKDDDADMAIYYEAGNWYIHDFTERDYGSLFYKIEGGGNSLRRPFDLDWSTPDGGDAYDDGQTPPTMSEYLNLQYKNGGRLDPAFLEQIRDYQIDNTIPNASVTNNLNPSSPQHIVGAAFNTRKAEIKNNTFSYIKYSDNTDVEQKKLNKWYGSISNTQNIYSINPPKDSKYPLLKVRRNDFQPIFEVGPGKNSTLNMFIRLQRPIQHFRPGTSYLVREKRGIFCTAYSSAWSLPFSIGYRSPYYNITGRPSYKSVFNNFSFVFSFGSVGYDATFGRPISRNLMTDYKFNFGQMYMLTIRSFDNYLAIYVNGELQEVAIVPFNPLVNATPQSSSKTQYVLELSGGTYSNGTYQGGFGATTLFGPDGKYIELSSPLIDSGGFGGDLYAVDPAHPNFPDYVYISASEGVYWYDDGNVPNAGTPPGGAIITKLQIKSLYKDRRDEMPLGPGFYKKNGTIYTNTDVESVAGINMSISELIFGKSSLAHGVRNVNSKKKRRYLNNLDIGVISSYSAALSQSDISQIYENFRYRYI